MSKYGQDGVNISAGDMISAYANKIGKKTYNNSPYITVYPDKFQHFRGPTVFSYKDCEGLFHKESADGVGTKVIVIDSAKTYINAFQDVLAMCTPDLIRFGGKAVSFSNVLDVSTLGEIDSETFNNFKLMFDGLGEFTKELDLVVLEGETAELSECVGSTNVNATNMFNIAGFAHGVFHTDRMITGEGLAPGQIILALQEKGFRSNGISSVREAMKMLYGESWYIDAPREMLLAAAKPSMLYDAFLNRLNGWDHNIFNGVKIHALPHITGGGVWGKFADDILFKRGLSAELHGLYKPPTLMQDLRKVRKMSEMEAYQVWNGGQGMLMVVDPENVSVVMDIAKQMNFSHIREVGFITKTKKTPTLTLISGYTGNTLQYKEGDEIK